jgi:D-alanyl-D-alanine dipeptidase
MKLIVSRISLIFLCSAILLFISCSEVVEGLKIFGVEGLLWFEDKENKLEKSDIEKKFLNHSLIDVSKLDSTLKIKLAYATTDNFTGINLYGVFNKCYLPKVVAKKLIAAQDSLKAKHPELSLLILDATRPRSVQQTMWDTCKFPLNIKSRYLAKPSHTSMHNYGAAIDLTLVDKFGKELDMGTPFDFFGNLAEPRMENYYLSQGKLSLTQIENRKILRRAMVSAGFISISNEWWHFDAGSRIWVKQNLKLIE